MRVTTMTVTATNKMRIATTMHPTIVLVESEAAESVVLAEAVMVLAVLGSLVVLLLLVVVVMALDSVVGAVVYI